MIEGITDNMLSVIKDTRNNHDMNNVSDIVIELK